MSESKEKEYLALKWSHMVVVVIGFGDYKPKEVVKEKLNVEQEPMVKKTQ